jgi:16S rRNA (guanine966-N2)-methyltransferase
MRVVAGSAGGRRLAPVPAGTRPVSDRAREGLFSSLGPLVEGARVLDLYAGTGALGIEALSRGAAEATFVDQAIRAIRAIRSNLARTGFADRATEVKREVLRWLGERDPEPFTLVFADPPYAESWEEVETVLDALGHGWLAPGWAVALTRDKKDDNPVIPVNWRIAKRLAYGDTLVLVYQEE